jgi:hypothetical protein
VIDGLDFCIGLATLHVEIMQQLDTARHKTRSQLQKSQAIDMYCLCGEVFLAKVQNPYVEASSNILNQAHTRCVQTMK